MDSGARELMEFSDWLRSWLARHPLKSPTEFEQSQLTRAVMERLRMIHRETHPSRHWRFFPRLSLIAATAMAIVFLAIMALPKMTDRSTAHLERERSYDQSPQLPSQGQDFLILAQEPLSDEQWLDETLEILQEFEEDPFTRVEEQDSSLDYSEDEWLKWLELLELLEEVEASTHSTSERLPLHKSDDALS